MNRIAVKYADKASGVYREILDATASPRVTVSNNVVVVIQSEQGPIMKPMLIKDKTELHTMFGRRDSRLEAKGSYGILMAEQVLERGPIWVLNIKNVNPLTEQLEMLDVDLKTNGGVLTELPVSEVYDTNKFWNIPSMYGKFGDHPAFSITSVLGHTVTVLIEPYSGKDYDYTVAETKKYNQTFLGEGLDDDALVSDYLKTVHIFKTDLNKAPLQEGLVEDTLVSLDNLDELKKDRAAKYFASYTGSIGNVIDKNGNNLNIAAVINADAMAHGCYAAINESEPVTAEETEPATAEATEPVTSIPTNVIHGLVSLEKHYVNGTSARQNEILDILNTDGIMNSFSDPTQFKCRYMVDTFKTYIEPNAKFQFAKLAEAAKRFLVFTSAPFYHELRTSKNPDFHDALGRFKYEYVKLGHNPDKPGSNTFNFPQDMDSAIYLVPTMNVEHYDGFATKVIPGAAVLASLFYTKLTGTRHVYDIVAGSDWPINVSGVVGPEFNPDIDERGAMEQTGINVIQNINGILQMRSNKTAFQPVDSAFNYSETLEKVFFVSDYTEPTLDGKIFKYNNQETRLAVKLRADEACQIMTAHGAINSYENICDLSNNTEEIRKKGIIVLDTVLYNEFGITIAVHRTKVATESAKNK